MNNTKIIALLLALVFALSALASCGNGGNGGEGGSGEEGGETGGETGGENETVYTTHAQYLAAKVGDEVKVKTYVQAKQGWWEKDGVGGVASLYTEDRDGGYFIYDMPMSAADYALLVPGTCIEVSGFIAEYAGLHEIADATFKILENEATYIASAFDISAKLKDDNLADYQCQFIAVKNAVVQDKGDGKAFFYGWDGTGSEGGDIYFDVMVDGEKYTFVIESYFTGSSTDVYKAAQALNIGDTIDIEGYLYWYNGPQPHVNSITVK